jgi:hypothetical protein
LFKPQKSKQQVKNEWPDESKLDVLLNAGKEPIQVIAKRINKSLTQVRNMATKIGVSYAHPDNDKVQ